MTLQKISATTKTQKSSKGKNREMSVFFKTLSIVLKGQIFDVIPCESELVVSKWTLNSSFNKGLRYIISF